MPTATYQARRGELLDYFDRTALQAWERLTSDAPVSSIRATVRAGRDAMRSTLLSWLPADLTGCRLLDAGCGTGALAIEAARRGAKVVAVDIAPGLIEIAKQRVGTIGGAGQILCEKTVGASYGDAFLAAIAVGQAVPQQIAEWNPVARTVRPERVAAYDRQYPLFKALYRQTRDIAHALGSG